MIHELDNQFDAKLILADYAAVCTQLFIHGRHVNQVNVNCPEQMTEDRLEQLTCLPGTNWDYNENEALIPENTFTKIADFFLGTYTETVVEALKQDYKIGRVRFLALSPRTNYSWHKDVEEVRIHIPLKTSTANFFLWQEGPALMADRMRSAGQAYLFHTKNFHTAVNADKEARVHLVANII